MNFLKIKLLLLVFIFSHNIGVGQIRIESQEEALRRQIELAKLKRQLEDIKSGKTSNYYEESNNNPRETFVAEIHYCLGYPHHNTSNEHHCFDLYFWSDGRVYWDRRKFARVVYNDELSGSYYIQENGYNRYDLYITWDNGKKIKGYITYKGLKPEIHILNHYFEAN